MVKKTPLFLIIIVILFLLLIALLRYFYILPAIFSPEVITETYTRPIDYSYTPSEYHGASKLSSSFSPSTNKPIVLELERYTIDRGFIKWGNILETTLATTIALPAYQYLVRDNKILVKHGRCSDLKNNEALLLNGWDNKASVLTRFPTTYDDIWGRGKIVLQIEGLRTDDSVDIISGGREFNIKSGEEFVQEDTIKIITGSNHTYWLLRNFGPLFGCIVTRDGV